MVDIVNDSVLEEGQTFSVVLSTADPDIIVQEAPTVVFIMDNDGIYSSSCDLTYSAFVLHISTVYSLKLRCQTIHIIPRAWYTLTCLCIDNNFGYCIARNFRCTIFSWISWLTLRSQKFCSWNNLNVCNEVAYIARSLKNERSNIESRKFKAIMNFLSQKFTLMLVWRDSQNFWITKIWSYTVLRQRDFCNSSNAC